LTGSCAVVSSVGEEEDATLTDMQDAASASGDMFLYICAAQ
jgi:hypothetical protein